MVSPSSALSMVPPRPRLQSTDVQAFALWGVTAGTAAIYLVQPFDWIRKTFFEKSDPEQK